MKVLDFTIQDQQDEDTIDLERKTKKDQKSK